WHAPVPPRRLDPLAAARRRLDRASRLPGPGGAQLHGAVPRPVRPVSGDREAILAAVRRAQGGAPHDAAAIAAGAASLLDGIDATRPDLGDEPTVERFAARVTGPRVNATLDRIAAIADLPAAVRRYLDAEGQ